MNLKKVYKNIYVEDMQIFCDIFFQASYCGLVQINISCIFKKYSIHFNNLEQALMNVRKLLSFLSKNNLILVCDILLWDRT